MSNGRQAEQRQDYDRAVVEYTQGPPRSTRTTPTRALRSSARSSAHREDHFNRGRGIRPAGKLEEALVEYQIASELNPAQRRGRRSPARDAQPAARAGRGARARARRELETLIERTRELPPPGLDLPQGLKLPASLVFREASSRDVFTALARFADVNIIFDPAFRDAPGHDRPAQHHVRGRADGARRPARATSTASRRPRTITIIPDTPAKRREYEEEVVRTFYLSNADLKETIDLLRMVVDVRRLAPITATNAITIKDTPERVRRPPACIAAIDKARPEVVIDVELLEVDRTRLLEYGLQIASPGTSNPAGISGSVDINQDGHDAARPAEPDRSRTCS